MAVYRNNLGQTSLLGYIAVYRNIQPERFIFHRLEGPFSGAHTKGLECQERFRMGSFQLVPRLDDIDITNTITFTLTITITSTVTITIITITTLTMIRKREVSGLESCGWSLEFLGLRL